MLILMSIMSQGKHFNVESIGYMVGFSLLCLDLKYPYNADITLMTLCYIRTILDGDLMRIK